jgi:hypothetical protein
MVGVVYGLPGSQGANMKANDVKGRRISRDTIRVKVEILRAFNDIEVVMFRDPNDGWYAYDNTGSHLFGPADGKQMFAFLVGLQWGPTLKGRGIAQ